MVDQEGGLVERLAGPPSASAAEMGDARARRGRRAGRAPPAATCAGYGINVDLAPVLDVGAAGRSDRRARAGASGGRPRRVIEAGVDGFAAGPPRRRRRGHRQALPRPRRRRGQHRRRLPEDRRRRGRGCGAVDEAPVRGLRPSAAASWSCSASPPTPPSADRPAAFSRRIATGELRRRLGFEGVSDHRLASTRRPRPASAARERVALAAAGAGSDLLLYGDWRTAREVEPAAAPGARRGRARPRRLRGLRRAGARAAPRPGRLSPDGVRAAQRRGGGGSPARPATRSACRSARASPRRSWPPSASATTGRTCASTAPCSRSGPSSSPATGVNYLSGFFGPFERALRDAGAAISFAPADFRRFAPLYEQQRPAGDVHGRPLPPTPTATARSRCTPAARSPSSSAPATIPTGCSSSRRRAGYPRTAGIPPEHPHRLHVDQVDVLIESDADAARAARGRADRRRPRDRRARDRLHRRRLHAPDRHRSRPLDDRRRSSPRARPTTSASTRRCSPPA